MILKKKKKFIIVNFVDLASFFRNAVQGSTKVRVVKSKVPLFLFCFFSLIFGNLVAMIFFSPLLNFGNLVTTIVFFLSISPLDTSSFGHFMDIDMMQ